MEAYPTELRVFSGGYPIVKLLDYYVGWCRKFSRKKQKLREEIPENTYPWQKRPAPRSTTQKKKGREVMELGCASNLVTR